MLYFYLKNFAISEWNLGVKWGTNMTNLSHTGQLSKHKRHKDKTAVLDFWEGLDHSIRSRKLNLVF